MMIDQTDNSHYSIYLKRLNLSLVFVSPFGILKRLRSTIDALLLIIRRLVELNYSAVEFR